MAKMISITFDGLRVAAREGQSVAAALAASGTKVLRRTAKGSPRGMFCGMGVCQDCLVTVDGEPNRRACMTVVREGLSVQTQVPRPRLDAAADTQERADAAELYPDVLVIGAGAGGLSAAIAARKAGAAVLVLDERKVGGGQYYKQRADGTTLDVQQAEGAALIAEAEASGAEILGGVEIWAAGEGPLVLAERAGSSLVVRPKTIVVATGAYERPAMVPGWTLPGVMTTGAAQTLWRSYGTLPGRRIVFCGSGPLNLQVALELARGGADVRMVAERAASPFRRPLTAAAMMAADPGLGAKGLSMMAALRRRGVPIRYGTALRRIEEKEGMLSAVFGRPGGAETAIETEIVCMNEGFEPQNEILRLMGAAFTYDPAVGHLRCQRSERMETSVRNLFAVGDCAGLGGAPAAREEGLIAGYAAAQVSLRPREIEYTNEVAKAQSDLERHRRFQALLWAMHDVTPRDAGSIDPETILCRCEEVTFAQARAALLPEAAHAGGVKRGTRIGMGACQGRYCGPVAARLAAASAARPVDERSFFAPRVPIKPISVAAIRDTADVLGSDA